MHTCEKSQLNRHDNILQEKSRNIINQKGLNSEVFPIIETLHYIQSKSYEIMIKNSKSINQHWPLIRAWPLVKDVY